LKYRRIELYYNITTYTFIKLFFIYTQINTNACEHLFLTFLWRIRQLQSHTAEIWQIVLVSGLIHPCYEKPFDSLVAPAVFLVWTWRDDEVWTANPYCVPSAGAWRLWNPGECMSWPGKSLRTVAYTYTVVIVITQFIRRFIILFLCCVGKILGLIRSCICWIIVILFSFSRWVRNTVWNILSFSWFYLCSIFFGCTLIPKTCRLCCCIEVAWWFSLIALFAGDLVLRMWKPFSIMEITCLFECKKYLVILYLLYSPMQKLCGEVELYYVSSQLLDFVMSLDKILVS